MLRAGRDTLLAALALLLVDDSDLLHRIDVDRVKRAGALAGAQAQAGVLAGLGAIVHQGGRDAVMNALIVLLSAVIAMALAGDSRYHADARRSGDAHDFRHLRSAVGATDGAGADLCLSLGHSSGIAVAARETAGAAVRARQALAQRINSRVGRNRKGAAGHAQQRAEDQTQQTDNERGGKNRSNTHFSFLPRSTLKSGR